MKKPIIFILKSVSIICFTLWTTAEITHGTTNKTLKTNKGCFKELLALPKLRKVKLSYATGFEVYALNSMTILRVKKPWVGAKDQFIFIGKDLSIYKLPICKRNSIHFPRPVSSLASVSTTHIPFIEVLGSLDTLKGFSGTHYISSPKVRKRISQNKIKNLGFPLNIEKVIKLNPDLLMAYTLEDPSLTGLGKLKKLGQRVVFNGEFKETHPLGRFEWIKFVGALLGKQQMANNIYKVRKDQYLNLKRKVSNQNNKNFPLVLVGRNYQGSWHLPGLNTYLSKLLGDAGAKQPWSKKTTQLFFPLNFETILKETQNTLFWLPQSPWHSKKEILREDSRYALLNPFKKNHIYTNNKRINSNGGNDYWEGALVNPHLLLKDLVKIFHPELLRTHKLRWYKRIL